MDKLQRDQIIKQYATLSSKKTEIEQQLKQLRLQIIEYCKQHQLEDGFESEHYRVKLFQQQRRQYDDQRLYDSLPDRELWRFLSKADASKISSMMQLNMISEKILEGTYTEKSVTILKVEPKANP